MERSSLFGASIDGEWIVTTNNKLLLCIITIITKYCKSDFFVFYISRLLFQVFQMFQKRGLLTITSLEYRFKSPLNFSLEKYFGIL